jgi:plasmid stabilization system protein ParE
MPQLIWSPAALRDIDRLHRFLLEKNASAARDAIKAVRTHVNILAEQPGAGRPAEHMDPEFREWIIPFGGSGYIALYRLDGEKVVILAVRHQREAGY